VIVLALNDISAGVAHWFLGLASSFGLALVVVMIFAIIALVFLWWFTQIRPYTMKANIYTTYSGLHGVSLQNESGSSMEHYGAIVFAGTKPAGVFKDNQGKPFYKIKGYDAHLPVADFRSVMYGNILNVYMASRLEFHPLIIELFKETITENGVIKEKITPRMAVLVNDKTINSVIDTISSVEFRFTWKSWIAQNAMLIAIVIVVIFAAFAIWLFASSISQSAAAQTASAASQDTFGKNLLEAIKIAYNRTPTLPAPPV